MSGEKPKMEEYLAVYLDPICTVMVVRERPVDQPKQDKPSQKQNVMRNRSGRNGRHSISRK